MKLCEKLDRIYMTAQANLSTLHWMLAQYGLLEWSWVLECWSALGHLSSPVLFQKSILNHFKFKTKLILLIPQQSLICHKLNLFRHPCNFPIGQTTTFDLRWRASHYLKRLLWPNIKKNKISNIKIRLNVLTPTIIIF